MSTPCETPEPPAPEAQTPEERAAAIGALHNASVGPLVADIVSPTIQAGGGVTDVLALTESVVLGVLLYAADKGFGPEVADIMLVAVKRRLHRIQQQDALRDAPCAGSA